MRRGPIIHGILLVGALLFAYQTWTREETVEPLTGNIVVWSVPGPKLEAIKYEIEGREIRVERRSDAQGPYFWGSDTRTIEQYLPPDPNKPKPDAGPGPKEPDKPVKVSTTREFMVGDKGDELFKNLTELRALRALGKIDDEKKELYGLHEKTQTISVIHDGGTHSLVLGSKVYGSGDRYSMNPATGEGYVVSEVVTRDIANGEAGLRLTKLHAYDDNEVAKAVIEVKGQKRTLLRIRATNESGRETKTWADATAPDKPNQTMANFLRNVEMLKPSRFVADTDLSKIERVVRVEYQTAAGAPLGWVELYHQPRAADAQTPGSTPATPATPAGQTPATPATPAGQTPATPAGQTPATPATPAAGQEAKPAGQEGVSDKDEEARRPMYIMRTEVTRIPAGVAHTTASRITEDIEQIFGQ